MNDVIGHIPMNRYKHFLSYINTDNRIAPIVIIINMPYTFRDRRGCDRGFTTTYAYHH